MIDESFKNNELARLPLNELNTFQFVCNIALNLQTRLGLD
jgi:hypothetical protein